VIDCGSVSVRHAEMERLDSGYVLRDLGSTNGTKADGERKQIIELRHGMVAQLGDVEFDFQLSEEEQAQMAQAAPEITLPARDPNAPPALPPLKGENIEDAVKAEPIEKEEKKHHKSSASQTSESSRSSLVVLFLLALGIAFFIGLSVRHHRELGTWIISESSQSAHPSPAPDTNPATAPETEPDAPAAAPAAPAAEPAAPAAEPAAPAAEPAAPPASAPNP
jgi:predicted component of type VI protein secretion system